MKFLVVSCQKCKNYSVLKGAILKIFRVDTPRTPQVHSGFALVLPRCGRLILDGWHELLARPLHMILILTVNSRTVSDGPLQYSVGTEGRHNSDFILTDGDAVHRNVFQPFLRSKSFPPVSLLLIQFTMSDINKVVRLSHFFFFPSSRVAIQIYLVSLFVFVQEWMAWRRHIGLFRRRATSGGVTIVEHA